MNDLKYALRQLRKNPGGNAVVIGTLALLIGVLSLAVGVYRAEQKRWMPFADADRLVRLWRLGDGSPGDNFPCEVFLGLARRCQGLESIGAIGGPGSRTVTGLGEPRRLSAINVSPAALQSLALKPVAGRLFRPGEEGAAVPPVLIAQDVWTEIFASAADTVGRTMLIDGVEHVVIGIMPPGAAHNAVFQGLDLWLPGRFKAATNQDHWVTIVGRLKPGVSHRQLNAELAAVVPPLESEYRARQKRQFKPAYGAAYPLDKQFHRVDADDIFLIAVVPALVLLIAGFNIANVLLTRMIARRREFGVRSSLGATRARLIRQLLIETTALAVVGGAIGMGAAFALSRWAYTLGFAVAFTPGVIGTALGLSILIGAAVGVLPALRATRGNLNRDLKGGLGSDIHRHRLRNLLVGGQVAMATALCVTGTLFMRSYFKKQDFNPGFDPSRMVGIAIQPRKDIHDTLPKRRLFARQIAERLRSVPGVEQLAISTSSAVNRNPFTLSVDFAAAPAGQHTFNRVRATAVSPEYFGTVNLPILRGRALTDNDRAGSPRALVVSESFVRHHLPEIDPIGTRVKLNLTSVKDPWTTIVGIVPDRPNVGFRRDFGPEVYVAFEQSAPRWGDFHFLATVHGPPAIVAQALRDAARSVDPRVAVPPPQIMSDRLDRVVRRDTGPIKAFAAIGIFGLGMALLGIYGVVANAVVERTHEIGLRLALGADRGDTIRLLLKQGLSLVAVGLLAGLGLSAATTSAINGMLFGINAIDPATYLGVAGIFLATALFAGLVPARRAARVQPMEALRHD